MEMGPVVTDIDVFAPDLGGGRENSERDWTGKVRTPRGRYELPHPETGKTHRFTRVTNFASTYADEYLIHKWQKSLVARGMAVRPDLVAIAKTCEPDDRIALATAAEMALECAGGNSGSRFGTALHNLCDKSDRRLPIGDPGPTMAADVAAYRIAMDHESFTVDNRFSERVVWVPDFDLCGRIDRLLLPDDGGSPLIGDLKTQKTSKYGQLEIAIQLTCYAHATHTWNEQTGEWEPFPGPDHTPINDRLAVVMHLPFGAADCQTYDVDIAAGWEYAQLAYDVRQARKAELLTRREPGQMSDPSVSPISQETQS